MSAQPTRKLRDSSKTRVAPVLSAAARSPGWVARIARTAGRPDGRPVVVPACLELDPTQDNCWWTPKERRLRAPQSLLEWLVHNVSLPKGRHLGASSTDQDRLRLIQRDATTREEALARLKRGPLGRAWYVLEGESYPDALVETASYILVVEGKRSERKATTDTRWMAGRHQMWRHMDAALEIAGGRPVLGLMIVEGADDGTLPHAWVASVRELTAEGSLLSSLPHRSSSVQARLLDGFIGLTTWQRIAPEFGLQPSRLPASVLDLPLWYAENGLNPPATKATSV